MAANRREIITRHRETRKGQEAGRGAGRTNIGERRGERKSTVGRDQDRETENVPGRERGTQTVRKSDTDIDKQVLRA